MNKDLEKKVNSIPNLPGCYLMKNEFDEIIYIGKAKALKKRVLQYFNIQTNLKTKKLVDNIKNIEYIITNSEKEALILENNLIKKHKPYYNIKLVDDKTYPYIVITDDKHPRVIVLRKKPAKYKKIYGPFPNQNTVREMTRFINQIFPFRKCYKIPSKKCFYLDINECLGPCVNKKNFDYSGYIKEVDDFLTKKSNYIIDYLKKLRKNASSRLNYELALKYQNLIKSKEFILEKQNIDNERDINADYVGYSFTKSNLSIFILKKRNGKIEERYKAFISYILDPKEELIKYLSLYYENQVEDNKIYINLDEVYTEELGYKVKNQVINPKVGEHKKAVELAIVNSDNLLKNKEKEISIKQIKKENLKNNLFQIFNFIPSKIDAIDISQLFGTNQVGAVMRIEEDIIRKEKNRGYNLLLSKNDDYGAIRATINKRFKDKKDLVDLILVDGAKGQVNAALSELKKMNLDILVMGLTKNDKHQLEKLFFKNNYIELDKRSELYNYFLKIDENIHNYAIRLFRKKQISNYNKSNLDNIKGIGSKRKELLLKNFKSLEEIKRASIDYLHKLGIALSVCYKIRKELNIE